MTKGFRLIATNHTSFTVSDLDRSIAFFRDGFDFQVVSRAPRDPRLVSHITGVQGADVETAYLRGPGHMLELIEYKAPAGRGKVEARPCDTGFAHIAFDVDNVEEAMKQAVRHGATAVAEPCEINAGPNKGRRIVYVRDWDGVTIEFIEGNP
jgi:catechol 2,3-dioxygenase-like lactoylglutathione lyase family enzyme